MRNKCVQMTLSDIYNDVSETIENQKPELIHLLDEHIDFDSLIPSDSILSETRSSGIFSVRRKR